MIDAKELRIDNWVEYNIIDQDKDYWIYAKVEISDLGDTSWLKPIPLTEEILLKCGFNKIKGFKYYDGSVDFLPVFCLQNYLIKSREGDSWGLCQMKSNDIKSVLSTKLKYLHQLQNLYFSLTGKELEVNL